MIDLQIKLAESLLLLKALRQLEDDPNTEPADKLLATDIRKNIYLSVSKYFGDTHD